MLGLMRERERERERKNNFLTLTMNSIMPPV